MNSTYMVECNIIEKLRR